MGVRNTGGRCVPPSFSHPDQGLLQGLLWERQASGGCAVAQLSTRGPKPTTTLPVSPSGPARSKHGVTSILNLVRPHPEAAEQVSLPHFSRAMPKGTWLIGGIAATWAKAHGDLVSITRLLDSLR